MSRSTLPLIFTPDSGSCFITQISTTFLHYSSLPTDHTGQLIKYDNDPSNGTDRVKHLYSWLHSGLPKGTQIKLPIWLCYRCVFEISRLVVPQDPDRPHRYPKVPNNLWLFDDTKFPPHYESKPLFNIQSRYSAEEISSLSSRMVVAAERFRTPVHLLVPWEPISSTQIRTYMNDFFTHASSEPLSIWALRWISPPDQRLVMGAEKVPAKLREAQTFGDVADWLVQPIMDRFSAHTRGSEKNDDSSDDSLRSVDLMENTDNLESDVMLSAQLTHILLLGLAHVVTETPSSKSDERIASILSALKVCFLGFETVRGNLIGLAAVLLSCPWVFDRLIYCAIGNIHVAAASCFDILLIATEIIKIFELRQVEDALIQSIMTYQDKLMDRVKDLDVDGNMTDNLARIILPFANILYHLSSSNNLFNSHELLISCLKPAIRILNSINRSSPIDAVMNSSMQRQLMNSPCADVILPNILNLLSICYTTNATLAQNDIFKGIRFRTRECLKDLDTKESSRRENLIERKLVWRPRRPRPHNDNNSRRPITDIEVLIDIDKSQMFTHFKPAMAQSFTNWRSDYLRYYVNLAGTVVEDIINLNDSDISALAAQIIDEFATKELPSPFHFPYPDPTRPANKPGTVLTEDSIESLLRVTETFSKFLEPRYSTIDPHKLPVSSTPKHTPEFAYNPSNSANNKYQPSNNQMQSQTQTQTKLQNQNQNQNQSQSQTPTQSNHQKSVSEDSVKTSEKKNIFRRLLSRKK